MFLRPMISSGPSVTAAASRSPSPASPGRLAADPHVIFTIVGKDLDDPSSTLGRETLVVMSEFGRRAGENASAGADHGHGNCLIVMGGHVNGNQVIASWPELATGILDNGDLAITVDYRDILAEILEERMACTTFGTVFPSYTIGSYRDITV